MAEQPLYIALVGGSGFIGRSLSRALSQRGHRVRIIARHKPAELEAGEDFVASDIATPAALTAALKGCDVVVNLVAILAERGTSFDTVIHQGARHVAQAAQTAGLKHVVYVSALGANAASPSAYARAKAHAEDAVRTVFPQSTVIRPSLVLGHGGGFSQQMELLTRYAPVMMMPGYGRTRFQPIECQALAELIADACTQAALQGQIVNAAGPDVLSFRQLAGRELSRLNRKRLLVPLPWWLTWAVAYTMRAVDKLTCYRLIPAWLLVTPDQVHLLQQDNVVNS